MNAATVAASSSSSGSNTRNNNPMMTGKKRKLSGTSTTGSSTGTQQQQQPVVTPASNTTNNTPNNTSPVEYLRSCFVEMGLKEAASRDKAWFLPITPERIEAYDKTLLKAVRERNLEHIQSLHQQRGPQSLQCCNRFGESLMHMACRNSLTELVRYLVLEAKVSLFVRDDYGRTPLHDACWTVEPNHELMDFLLRQAPELLCLVDVRGHMPFAYVRRNHWSGWVQFLQEREDVWKQCNRIPAHVLAALPSKASSNSTTSSSDVTETAKDDECKQTCG